MKKKILCIISIILVIGLLCGCSTSNVKTTPKGNNDSKQTELPNKIKNDKEKDSNILNGKIEDFDDCLIEYLNNNGYLTENYMISPLSFRSAVALAIVGAKGDTQTQLLNAIGFETVDEMIEWYSNVLSGIDSFDEILEFAIHDYEEMKELGYYYDKPEWVYKLANSIWVNTDRISNLSNKYIKDVENIFNADSITSNSSTINNDIDLWVSNKTNGFIKKLDLDLSSSESVLVNTVYLKSTWIESFSDGHTKIGDFLTYDDEIVEKEFMENTGRYYYIADLDYELVCIPLYGNINVVYVIGNSNNIKDKVETAEYELVHVKIPKIELDTRFSNSELKNFLIDNGAELAFTNQADFSAMLDDNSGVDSLNIDDIAQITRIMTDEDGLEASAVTVVTMETSAMVTKPQKEYEFIADHPFSFYILDGNNDNEVIFYGQIVK